MCVRHWGDSIDFGQKCPNLDKWGSSCSQSTQQYITADVATDVAADLAAYVKVPFVAKLL